MHTVFAASAVQPFLMLLQVGSAHSAVLAAGRVFLLGKDEIRQAVIAVQGVVQSVLFVIDVFLQKESLLV